MRCTDYQPDHNGECLNCDEWADAHISEAVFVRFERCHTQACGTAEVWQIGRLRLRICQQCAAHVGTVSDEETGE